MGNNDDNGNPLPTKIKAKIPEDTEEQYEEQAKGRERVICLDAQIRNVYNLRKQGGKPYYQYWYGFRAMLIHCAIPQLFMKCWL